MLIEQQKDEAQKLLAMMEKLPPSRELSIARTKLEECSMWLSKAMCISYPGE